MTNLPPHVHGYRSVSTSEASLAAGDQDVTFATPVDAVTASTGAGAPVSILDPALGMRFCIVYQGYFPSRP